jgi:hypothetical protein
MKHLKKFKSFINESMHSHDCNPLVDKILDVQNLIDPSKCEFNAYTKDELCELSEEELVDIFNDVNAAKASCISEEEEISHSVDDDDESDDSDDDDDDVDDNDDDNYFDEVGTRRIRKFVDWIWVGGVDHGDDDNDDDIDDIDDIDEFEEDIDSHKDSDDKNDLPSEMW